MLTDIFDDHSRLLGKNSVHDKVIPCTVENKVGNHQSQECAPKGGGHNRGIEIVVHGFWLGTRNPTDSMFIITIDTPNARELRVGQSGSKLKSGPKEEEKHKHTGAEQIKVEKVISIGRTRIKQSSDELTSS